MAMKRTLLGLSLLITHLSFCVAQDVAKDINRVKRDTMYIYAEATMKDLNEAYNGARAILEMKVGDWVRNQHPYEGIEVCIVKAKEHFVQLETRRGDFYRAFVYVRKTDIMPVADKSEVTVFEVAPVVQPNQVETSPAIIVEEEPVEVVETPVLELTSEEKQMRQIRSFYEVEPYLKGLESKGKVNKYGKYATMPVEEDCHLFVYDKQGNISALLRKVGTTQYNLNTLKEDNVKNYKNCGAIWFQLK
jgi:hypothetical protein